MADSEVNILIVDDREENIISLQSIIEGEKRQIYTARSGNEALKQTLSVSFDLILCDVQMPGMDGFEMLELLRMDPRKRYIPFIFITAINKEDKYVHRGYNEGAVDYLFKPLNTDITRAKVDVFVEMAKQKKELEQKNIRLKSLSEQKNQFLGMLAHDLRNPIGVLQYNSDILLQELSATLTQEQIDALNSMKESSTYMLNLVNDLLDISHLESGKMTLTTDVVNIEKLIRDIISSNRFIAREKNITLEANIDADLPALLLDEQKIRQVLNNLITNAVKFSFSETIITVSVQKQPESLLFKVKDQGQGIPESELDKLFKPYQTTSVKSTQGEKSTGLGLLICNRIVEAHGGKIKVASTVGKGSEFFFEIPVKKGKAVINTEEMILPRDKNILVVDDNNINQLVLKRLLEGNSIVFANTGTEAVQAAQKQKFDFIFMDVEMPEMNGIDAARLILARENNDLKIIGCTGHHTENERKKCLDAGMIACVTKPVNRQNLSLTFKEILE